MLITATSSAKFVSNDSKRHKSNDEFAIIAIGRVGRDFFVKRGMNVVLDIIGSSRSALLLRILKILQAQAVGMFTDGTFDELYIYYSHYVSAISNMK